MSRSTVRLEATIGCGLVLLTFLSYWGIWNFDFVSLDDPAYVIANPHVHGLTAENVRWALTSTHLLHWAPLSSLSFMVDYELWGLDAGGYHLDNLLLHAVGVVLLFLAMSRMTGAVWPSAAVAAIFAAHPVHVEAVAWISERKEVASSVFWMAALLAYVHYTRRPGWARYAGVVLAMVLGLMCKATLVALPLTLVALDYWPLGRLRSSADLYRRLIEKAPLLVAAAASSLVTLFFFRDAILPGETLGIESRLANAALAYVRYIRMFLWPVGLAAFYPHAGRDLSLIGPAGGAAVAVIAATALAVWMRARAPYLLTGWLWYLLTLLPVIGLIQVGDQAIADRYLHISSIGLSMILVWGAADLAARAELRRGVLAATAVVLILALGAAARLQAGYWRNGIALDQRTVDVTEGSYLPHRNLALALANAGRLAEAVEHFQAALRLAPHSATDYSDLALCYVLLDRDAEAQAALDRALELEPAHAGARRNLAILLASTDRIPEAIAQIEQTLGPAGAERAALELAAELERLGRRAEAERVRERVRP